MKRTRAAGSFVQGRSGETVIRRLAGQGCESQSQIQWVGRSTGGAGLVVGEWVRRTTDVPQSCVWEDHPFGGRCLPSGLGGRISRTPAGGVAICWWLHSTVTGPQKDIWEGGRGVAAHSISPRPLARAREIWVPTFSDRVAVSAPARMASAFANRRQSVRAAGPSPPVESTPNGEKSQPATWQTALLCTIFARSASAAADNRPSRSAEEAEERTGWDTVTSVASGRGSWYRLMSYFPARRRRVSPTAIGRTPPPRLPRAMSRAPAKAVRHAGDKRPQAKSLHNRAICCNSLR